MALNPLNSPCKVLFKEGTVTALSSDQIKVDVDWEYAHGEFWVDWYYDCGEYNPDTPGEIYNVGDRVLVEADEYQDPLRVVGFTQGARSCYTFCFATVSYYTTYIAFNNVVKTIQHKELLDFIYAGYSLSGYALLATNFAYEWPYRFAINVFVYGTRPGGGTMQPSESYCLMVWGINEDTLEPYFEGYYIYGIGGIYGGHDGEEIRDADGKWGIDYEDPAESSCYSGDYINLCGGGVTCNTSSSSSDTGDDGHCTVDWQHSGSGTNVWTLAGDLCCGSRYEPDYNNVEFYLPKTGSPLIYSGGERAGEVWWCYYQSEESGSASLSRTWSQLAGGDPCPYSGTCTYYWGLTRTASVLTLDCETQTRHTVHSSYAYYVWDGEDPYPSLYCPIDYDGSQDYETDGSLACGYQEQNMGGVIWEVPAPDAAGDWPAPLEVISRSAYPFNDGCPVATCDGCSCCAADYTVNPEGGCTVNNRYSVYGLSISLGRVIGNGKLFYNKDHYYENTYGIETVNEDIRNIPIGHYIDVEPVFEGDHAYRPYGHWYAAEEIFFAYTPKTGSRGYKSYSPLRTGLTEEVALPTGLSSPLNDPTQVGLLVNKDGIGFARVGTQLLCYTNWEVVSTSGITKIAPASGPAFTFNVFAGSAIEIGEAYCLVQPSA